MKEDKVRVLCPCCETLQQATPTEDGRYQIDDHHEPNDSPAKIKMIGILSVSGLDVAEIEA